MNGANMTTETKVAWTQGPWQLHPRSPEISPQRVPGDEYGDGFDSWTARVSAGEKVVADVLGWTTTRGWGRADNPDEVLANARLISAAPEMYAMLQAIVDRIACTDGMSGPWAEMMDDIDDVMSKAEGNK